MLNPDFRDMLCALNDEGVEYLLVGAYALAVHDCPRATGDMGLCIRRSTENAERVWRTLRRFGAPLLNLTLEDLSAPDVVFPIGVAPQRIDLLTSISGVEFDDAWPDALETELEGLVVRVLSRRRLIENKKSTGRAQDLPDAAWLESANDSAT
ncbi:MAG: hypothetical protein ACREJB_13390 [Planctomycetaceae bacterium]